MSQLEVMRSSSAGSTPQTSSPHAECASAIKRRAMLSFSEDCASTTFKLLLQITSVNSEFYGAAGVYIQGHWRMYPCTRRDTMKVL
ncbi:hypothetical protein PZA11_000193 [Diplocarpon coronariae]